MSLGSSISLAVKDRAAAPASICAASRRPRHFPSCGFLREWLERGLPARCPTSHRSAERRGDVRARPAVGADRSSSLGTLYNTDRPYSTEFARSRRAQIARYAWGDDYHDVIGDRHDACSPGCAQRHRGAVRGARLRRHRAGAGARLRAARRHRLDREEHLRDQPELGSWMFLSVIICSLPLERGRAGARSVRHLHAVHRGVPDAGARRARRARRDAAASRT